VDDDVVLPDGYGPHVTRIRELWRTDRGQLVHYLVALSIAVYLVVEMATNEQAPGSLVVLAVIAAIALLFTRDAPFVAPLVVGAALATIIAVDSDAAYDTTAPFLALLFMAWSLGTYNERTRAIVGLVAYELLGLWANIKFSAENGAADYFFVGLLIGVAWLTGFLLSRRAAEAREMADQAVQLQREHVAAAERAVMEERQRIARELHDVIAHSVSVMTVQTGAVRRLLQPEQEKERHALETVEATGRQALTEMRRLVGLLREQGAMPEFSPQPGLSTIDLLLDGVRAAGLPVDLEVVGSPHELPPGVDLAAYRVVQEALTNALKYAGPAHAWVEVTWGDDELELTIANDGRTDGDASGGGQGLDGMRERVSLYGGEIASGARDGGGYVVRARLPIGEAAP
jgi:signal transduction histidine kinase